MKPMNLSKVISKAMMLGAGESLDVRNFFGPYNDLFIVRQGYYSPETNDDIMGPWNATVFFNCRNNQCDGWESSEWSYDLNDIIRWIRG